LGEHDLFTHLSGVAYVSERGFGLRLGEHMVNLTRKMIGFRARLWAALG
jgi:hypothetical protein